MKLGLVGLIIVSCLMVFISDQTNAHVLISEKDGKSGAVVHFVPDDDPIAGKQATLFFDSQNATLDEKSIVTLTIESVSSSEMQNVEAKVDGSLITASYIFPYQGVYTLSYAISSSEKTYHFEHTVRVTRGGVKNAESTSRHIWAEALLLSTVIVSIFLVGIAWRHRSDIARQSTF